jgi:hypothetical protein
MKGKAMPKPKSDVQRRKQKQGQPNRIPLLLIIGGVIGLMVAAFFVFRKPASTFTPEVKGGPSAKVDKTSVDLGDYKLGSTAKVAFTVTNVGDQNLRFTEEPRIEVKEGC